MTNPIRKSSQIRRMLSWAEINIDEITLANNDALNIVANNSRLASFALLLLVTRPLPKDGDMAEDHGAPEAGRATPQGLDQR